MFPAERVLEVLDRVRAAVVDGGWGVDALVGAETRPHDDLDLVVRMADYRAALESLHSLGYEMTRYEPPARALLADGRTRVDLHLVSSFGPSAVQELPGGRRFTYVLDDTTGTIGGATVRCLSAPMQVLTHSGYEPDANDRADVAAVSARSGQSLPPPYVTLDGIELRPAVLDDVAALVAVRQRSWFAAYAGRMPQPILDAMDLGADWLNWCAAVRVPPVPSLRITVAGRPGAVHGFSAISACRDDDAGRDTGEIRLLYADPAVWGSGVGAALLRAAVDRLREMGFDGLCLWTLRENDRARAFYERFGWRPDGVTKTVEQPGGSYVEVRYRLVGS